MKHVVLDNVEVPYVVKRKRNKNTYFYFKRDGYVQINLSRHQSERDAVAYMQSKASQFASKFKAQTIGLSGSNAYTLWGRSFDQEPYDGSEILVDEPSGKILEPITLVDRDAAYKTLEKQWMMSYVEDLISTYKDSPYVDIHGVTFKTRYTTSRHGSCNPKRRTINLNLHLIRYDKIYTEYVFCHEIAHLVHPNHSTEYYALLGRLFPDYKRVRKELKEIW